MPCPSCGGSDQYQIAPGYFECVSVVTSWAPGPGYSVERVPVQRTCGVKYQEGPPAVGAQVCDCGTYAIGVCVACQAPVCGSCSWVADDRKRRCGPCIDARKQHLAELEQAAERAEAVRREAFPDQEHADRVYRLWFGRYLRGVKEVYLTGADLAACMVEAAYPGIEYTETKRPIFKRPRLIRGWTLEPGESDPGNDWAGTTSTVLADDGSLWRVSRNYKFCALEKLGDPSDVYGPHTFLQLCSGAGMIEVSSAEPYENVALYRGALYVGRRAEFDKRYGHLYR